MPPLPVINVADFRLLAVDDPTAIRDAVQEARNRNISVVYFPAGEYALGSFEGSPSLRFADLHCLTFTGDGDCTVLRRIDDAPADDPFSSAGILGFDGCTDITFMDMAVDLNGFQPSFDSTQRGVLEWNRCDRIRVQNVTFMDFGSRVADDLSADLDEWIAPERISHRFDSAHHLGLVFTECDDVGVLESRFITACVAVHGGSRVTIAGNVMERSHGHAIAVGSSVEGVRHEDISIIGNFLDEPLGFGIVVADVPPSPAAGFSPASFRAAGMARIRIEDNTILKAAPPHFPRGIVVGFLHDPAADEVLPDDGYAHVQIRDNLVDLSTSLERDLVGASFNTFEFEVSRVAGIWLQVPLTEGSLAGEGPLFEQAVVTGNVVKGAAYTGNQASGTGLLAMVLRNSEVAGNGVYDGEVGFHFAVALATHVHDNRARVSQEEYKSQFVASDLFSGNATISTDEVTEWEIGRSAAEDLDAAESLFSWWSGGDQIRPDPGREEL